MTGVDERAAMAQMQAILQEAGKVCGNDPKAMVCALIGSVATLAGNVGAHGDAFLRIAIDSLAIARDALAKTGELASSGRLVKGGTA